MKSKTISAIDLFCGAGGLTRGLLNTGIQVTHGVDLDMACQYAYEKNNAGTKFVGMSVADLSGQQLSDWFGNSKVKLLAGCAPCQPFSKYSSTRKSKDEKWTLLNEFERLIKESNPQLITMENVPQLRTHPVFLKFAKSIESLGYSIDCRVVSCAQYGLPQMRRRLVLVGSRLGKISFIAPTTQPNNYRTVRDAISHLPPLAAGERDPHDPLHYAASLSEINLRRIVASTPGGTWRDWPKKLRAECHNKETGATYASVYGRMEWDRPSPTITTQSYGFGNGRFGHPEQNRALSLREAAILQSFPDDYVFFPKDADLSTRQICTMIGNAVPVKLGEIVGESFRQHLAQLDKL